MVQQARTYEQIVALGREASDAYGTPVTVTTGLPVTDVTESAQLTATYDEGRRGVGSSVFNALQDAGNGQFTIAGFAYPVEIGHFLMAMMGSLSTTGAADPYSHAFAQGVNPPSYTIESRIVQGSNGGIQVAGARIGSLGFSYEAAAGVLAYTSEWMGKIPIKVTPTDPTVAPADDPWEAWRAVVTSTGLLCRAVSADFTLSRELQVVHTGCGDQDPREIIVGPLNIEGSLNLAVDDLTDFDKFIAGTRQSLVIQFDNAATSRSITFTISDAFLGAQPLEFDRGGVGVFNRLSFRGVHNSTDSGVCAVALENGDDGSEYAEPA